MKHGSLFSGIGGFDLAFECAGFETAWQVEKEPFCRAILKTHFPKAVLHEDVKQVGRHNLAEVDIITGGFPCQGLSVAGQRRGLEDPRSGLFWQAHRIVGEVRPRWFCLENVPGLFSSNKGIDFLTVVNALADLGYGVAWRVFDSRHFGVAQRRRRVFIVGYLGAPCPREILFELEGCQGNTEACRETGQEIAGSLGGGSHGTGRRTEDDQNFILANSITANTVTQGTGRVGSRGCGEANLVANTLSASAGHHGHSSPRGDGSDNLVAAPITDSYGKQIDSSDRNGGPPNIVVSQEINAHGMRDTARIPEGLDDSEFPALPKGLDSPRYRALGNAVTVNVAQWIAERIVRYERNVANKSTSR